MIGDDRRGVDTISAVALLLFAGVSLFLSYRLNMWVDEAYTFRTTGGGAVFALREALRFEAQPPLYFVALSIWRLLNPSLFWGRIFSLGSVFGALVVLRRSIPSYFSALETPLFLALVSSPFALWAATELRSYGLSLLWCALLIHFFLPAFVDTPRRRWHRVWFGVVAVAGLYTHYFVGFLLVGFGAYLLIKGKWRPLFSYLVVMGAVAVSLLPLIVTLPDHVIAHQPSTEGRSTAPVLRLILSSAELLVVPYGWLSRGIRMVLRLVALFAVGLTAIRRRSRVWGIARGPLALWAGTLVGAAVAAVLLPTAIAQHRHLFALWIPGVFVFFSFLHCWDGVMRTRLVWSAAIVMTLLGIVSSFDANVPPVKQGDYPAAADFLEERAAPGEPIMVFAAEAELPLTHYYSGEAQLVPVPQALDFRRYDVRDFAVPSVSYMRRNFGPLVAESPRLWLVDYGVRSYLGVDFGFDNVIGFLLDTHEKSLEREFQGLRVLRFDRRPRS